MQTSTAPPAPVDEAAIHGLVDDLARAIAENDVDLAVRHLTEDVVLVPTSGRVVRGRDAAARAHHDAFTGPLRDAAPHFRLTDLASLGREAATGLVLAWPDAASAEAGAPPQMTALYVFTRRNGRWQVSRRQMTLVS